MPRVARGPRNSVKDRPARLKLLLRRQKRLLRPAAWGVFVWREFAGAPASARKLLALMFALFLIGLGMVASAPLYA